MNIEYAYDPPFVGKEALKVAKLLLNHNCVVVEGVEPRDSCWVVTLSYVIAARPKKGVLDVILTRCPTGGLMCSGFKVR